MLFTLPDGDPAPPAKREQKSPFTPSLKAGPEQRCLWKDGGYLEGRWMAWGLSWEGLSRGMTPTSRPTPLCTKNHRSLRPRISTYPLWWWNSLQHSWIWFEGFICGVTCQRLNLKSHFEPFGLEISVSVVGEVSPTYSSLDLWSLWQTGSCQSSVWWSCPGERQRDQGEIFQRCGKRLGDCISLKTWRALGGGLHSYSLLCFCNNTSAGWKMMPHEKTRSEPLCCCRNIFFYYSRVVTVTHTQQQIRTLQMSELCWGREEEKDVEIQTGEWTRLWLQL